MVQNAAARLLTGTKKKEHITPVLASLHWLPIKLRVDFKIILFVYKALQKSAPDYICDLIQPHSTFRSLRSCNQLLLPVHCSRCKSNSDRAFAVGAPKLWNSLPFTIRAFPSLNVFKSCIWMMRSTIHLIKVFVYRYTIRYFYLCCFLSNFLL